MLVRRLKFSYLVIVSLMLAFIGFAGFNEANGQELCPGVPFDNGWVRFDVVLPAPSPLPTRFTAGLSGSVETDGTDTFGGLDWLYNDDSTSSAAQGPGSGTNTTNVGTQLVGWWSQAGGRSTHIQVTNPVDPATQSSELGTDPLSAPLPLSIHVQLLDDACVEILDFCDTYTPQDTHVYDFGNLVSNAGVDIPEAQLAGKEGIITVTPVVSCPTDDRAIEYDFLYGTSRMINASGPYDFGVNLWARDAEATSEADGNLPDPASPNCECGVRDLDPTDVGICDGGPSGNSDGALILDGGVNCNLRPLDPALLSQNFSILPTTVTGGARADVVLISIIDAYNTGLPTLGYTPIAGTATFFPDIIDENETPISCPQQTVCFARLGIDDAQVNTDTPLPTPTPTPTPTPSPSPSPGASPGTSPSPGASPDGDGGGGGGSCAIAAAAGPASAGAIVNILIPLLPVFGFGLARVVSRRRKEEE